MVRDATLTDAGTLAAASEDACRVSASRGSRDAGMRAGSILDGKYEIIRSIGHGGMSVVWLAQDVRLGKLWAIKEIKPNVSGAQGEAMRQALLDEAHFMKRLEHYAIPRVTDILDTGETVFVVMDYVNGTALDRVLAERGRPFSQEEVIAWGIQLCDVLEYLHGLRPPVVYRDMKPANVLLRGDGSCALIDFGIALELTPAARRSPRRIGSAGYSAPEQLDADAQARYGLDERADVYALGATLYSLVTGHVPHRVGVGAASGVDFDMRPIREVDPQLSDGLEAVLAKATQPVPDDRYASVRAMRHALEHYEELTQEWRVAQQEKVNAFLRQVRAACCALVAALALLGASLVARNSSYDSLMHDASLAKTEERVSRRGQPLGASEAEELYARAIEVAPGRIEPYERLVGVFKADDVFTPTESDRWVRLWRRHGREVRDDGRYARLCYDVGILYLCYYDFLGAEGVPGGARGAVAGQAALENAARSSVWFASAREACDPEAGSYRGLRVDDDLDEYAALLAYQTIGDFHDTILRANREGADATEAYGAFWRAITAAVGEGGVIERAEPIVQLRLLQVAFESVSSATNLSGFAHAGVRGRDALGLLEAVAARRASLDDFVKGNAGVAGPLAAEIDDGYAQALANVQTTFNGPVARLAPQTDEEVL